MLAMLGTRFQTTAAHTRPRLGAALPPGLVSLDPPASGQAMAVGVHSGVFNQALHTLWRGGYFDVDLGEGDLNGLIPPGVVLKTTAGLPPIVTIRADGRVEAAMGVRVNDALPALPIPGFRIPATLVPYGLPAGGVLGLVNPVLATESAHFVLRGNFRIR